METICNPAFGPFIGACRDHGIPKTTAYDLLNAGLLETFTVGRRRYVILKSLHELPEKLRERGAREVA